MAQETEFPYRGKAVAFTKPYHAEVVSDVGFGTMDADGVVLKTLYSVISRGTEMDLYTNQFHQKGERGQYYPLIPGYLPVGEVVEVGKNVRHLKLGDIAIGSNIFTGLSKPYCTAWGGHTEYVVFSRHTHPRLAAARVLKVPDQIEPRYAPLAVLGAIARHGITKKVRPQKYHTVLVVGQGVIGNFCAQICQEQGAQVIVTDLEALRLECSRNCGLAETINAREEPLQKVLMEKTEGKGVDAVIDVTGDPSMFNHLWSLTKADGLIHGQGMYLDPLSLHFPSTLFGRRLSLTCTSGEQPEHVHAVLGRMANGRLKYEKLLSEVRSVTEATVVYQRVHDCPNELMTVALDWTGS